MKKNESAIMSLAQEVSQVSGVQLGEKQKDMVVQRLRRRMTLLGLKDEVDYVQYYLENRKDEFLELISLFTTHHTYFFREYKHFELLRAKVLPQLISEARRRADKTIHIWSAACSRGQEVYSLAIFMERALEQLAPDLKFRICGTDIDIISVEFAKNAVFTKQEIDAIPLGYQQNSFVRGTGDLANFGKIHPRLRKTCVFQTTNLLDVSSWPTQEFDVIFCRNVFIYFSPEDMQKTALAFQKKLTDFGYLFLGLTETLNGLSVNLKNAGHSTYAKENEKQAKAVRQSRVISQPAETKVQKVLCVDDSPTILRLLRQIFSKDNGFVVADTAANGQEALEKIKNGTYDLITLDIHMPIMTGLEFLKKCAHVDIPPVIVISSVDRQEKSLALEMLKLGAQDYVEKPNMQDFNQRRDEILLKARVATQTGKTKAQVGVGVPLFEGRDVIASARGSVGVIFKQAQAMNAQSYIDSSAGTRLEHMLIPISEISFPTHVIAACDAVVVMSHLTLSELERLKKTNTKVFLLEDLYPSEPSPNFEVFPMASLSYAVARHIRRTNSEKE